MRAPSSDVFTSLMWKGYHFSVGIWCQWLGSGRSDGASWLRCHRQCCLSVDLLLTLDKRERRSGGGYTPMGGGPAAQRSEYELFHKGNSGNSPAKRIYKIFILWPAGGRRSPTSQQQHQHHPHASPSNETTFAFRSVAASPSLPMAMGPWGG